jgi:hypothetical protein
VNKAVVLAVLFLVLALLPATSALAEDVFQMKILPKEDPLFGTWINKDYDGSSFKQTQKWVFASWGYGERSTKMTAASGTPEVNRFTFVVVDKWTDAKGNSCYKIVAQEFFGMGYHLCRVSKDQKSLEITWRSSGFPAESDIHPGYSNYWKYQRQ